MDKDLWANGITRLISHVIYMPAPTLEAQEVPGFCG